MIEQSELALQEGGSPPGVEGTSSHGSSASGHIRKGAPIGPAMPTFHEQGSPEWHAERLGKVTASRFKDILTLPRSKKDREAGVLSATARSYMMELVAEVLTGLPQGPKTNAAMQWGKDWESAAADVYAETTGRELQEVGFTLLPGDSMIGGSPDRLIGADGGLEIKCPFNPCIHLETVYSGVVPKEHIPQIQGYMWETGRKWWDFESYDPRIEDVGIASFIRRVERDDEYIADLSQKVTAFRDKFIETLCVIKSRGKMRVTKKGD